LEAFIFFESSSYAGVSLLNKHAQEINQRQWDLSSMGFLVNAGEQIVAKTARNFLKLLQT